MSALLQVNNLTMQFGGLTAIDHVSFALESGDITALIGPNGAGKTTLFNCLTGFYKPTSGGVVLNTEAGSFHLEQMKRHDIVRHARLARTFQNIRLFPKLTVLENLLVAQHTPLMKAAGLIGGLLNSKKYMSAMNEAMELSRYWLNEIGLIERANDPASSLPYGAQRRLEIARAMCTRPRLLCLDEPAAGLNGRESAELNTLLLKIRKEHQTSIFLIEHDMSVVMNISDHVIVIDHGSKIADSTPAHIKTDPKVIAAYLGVEDDEVHATLAEVKT